MMVRALQVVAVVVFIFDAALALSIYGSAQRQLGWDRRGCHNLVYTVYPRWRWEADIAAGQPMGEWPAEFCVDIMGEQWRDEVMDYYDNLEAGR